MITGMPGGYGVICSAQMRPTAFPAETVSLAAKNASRGRLADSRPGSAARGNMTGLAGAGRRHGL